MIEAPLGRRQADTSQVMHLDATLWRQVAESATRADFAAAWLALQCRMIEGANRGLLMLAGPEPGSFEPAAIWPEHAGKMPDLAEAAKGSILERQGLSRGTGRPEGFGQDIAIAYPIVIRDQIEGAVAIGGGLDVRAALRQLQWGVAWIREHLEKDHGDTQKRLLDQSSAVLDLLASALEQDGFKASALAVVTELALRFDCTRVSLGFCKGRSIWIAAISHTAHFRRQMNLIAHLAGAKNEAVDQKSVILFPAGDPNVAVTAHAELARLEHDSILLTIPVFKIDRFIGAFTFARPRDLPFDGAQCRLLEAVAACIGPVLDEKRRNDRWLITKLAEAAQTQIVRLFGPGHLVRKTGLLAVLALACFCYFAKQTYRVEADAQIEGLVRRAVVAAYDGFIRESNVRAGDTVKKDQQLAALDDRDLALERLRWVTERQQRTYEYDKALASHEPAVINVTEAQIAQADAQIKLLDEQLSRVTLRSPISGLVVSGDLSQLIGASVTRGQVLFEIAPLDGYRVIIPVDEREIGRIVAGQRGKLLTSALPDQPFEFTVDKITPVAEAKSGRNTFRVEGHLTETSDRLRPGLEGIAKIEIGQERLIWIWAHPMLDWMRIWLWQWLP